MRYSRGHKHSTRQRILTSAARLFVSRGFEATSIDDIMRGCGLTRGGFYAHFKSKGDLYREAMAYSVARAAARRPAREQPDRLDKLHSVLRECLKMRDGGEASLTFLSADAASEQPEVRTAYNSALQLLTQEVERVVGESHDPGVAVSITALIVGALTIARATDDPELRAGVLQSCQQRAQALLALEPEPDRLSFFWMPPAGEQRVTEHSVGSGLMQGRSA